ncbi:MAG: hypothetical protein OCD01_03410 [Fibrobacterales bacterium]
MDTFISGHDIHDLKSTHPYRIMHLLVTVPRIYIPLLTLMVFVNCGMAVKAKPIRQKVHLSNPTGFINDSTVLSGGVTAGKGSAILISHNETLLGKRPEIKSSYTIRGALAVKVTPRIQIFYSINPILQSKSLMGMHHQFGMEYNIPLTRNLYYVTSLDLQQSSLESSGDDSTYFYTVNLNYYDCDDESSYKAEQLCEEKNEDHRPNHIAYTSEMVSAGLLNEIHYETPYLFMRGGLQMRYLSLHNSITQTIDKQTSEPIWSSKNTLMTALNVKVGVNANAFSTFYLSGALSTLFWERDFKSTVDIFVEVGLLWRY